jgi:hypothetical protein
MLARFLLRPFFVVSVPMVCDRLKVIGNLGDRATSELLASKNISPCKQSCFTKYGNRSYSIDSKVISL